MPLKTCNFILLSLFCYILIKQYFQVENLIKAADRDEDGLLNFEEFVHLMTFK